MSIAHTWTDSVRSTTTSSSTFGAGSSVSGSGTEVGSTEVSVDVQLGAGVTNQDEVISVAYATLQSMILLSDNDCTIKTNSTGSPANTWNLKANRAFLWRASDGYFTNPVSANITHLYITTSLPARVQCKFLNS